MLKRKCGRLVPGSQERISTGATNEGPATIIRPVVSSLTPTAFRQSDETLDQFVAQHSDRRTCRPR